MSAASPISIAAEATAPTDTEAPPLTTSETVDTIAAEPQIKTKAKTKAKTKTKTKAKTKAKTVVEAADPPQDEAAAEAPIEVVTQAETAPSEPSEATVTSAKAESTEVEAKSEPTEASDTVKAAKTTKKKKKTKSTKVEAKSEPTEASDTAKAAKPTKKSKKTESTEVEAKSEPTEASEPTEVSDTAKAARPTQTSDAKVAASQPLSDDGDDEPPSNPFADIPAPLRKALERKGFERLTRVQLAALEAIDAQRDLQVSSQTGSGKTVALGLVMAPDILENAEADRKKRGAGPRALIITPTRELAAQVSSELAWLFASVPGVKVLSVTGGTSVDRDRSRLASGPRIVVGTPGRLLDHIRNGALDCSKLSQLALDEADQMLDMGFRDELEAILESTPDGKHTHLVSATFPHAIKRLAQRYQKNPLHVEGTRLGAANEDIEHVVHVLHPRDRYNALVNILLLAQAERTLVFVKTRIETAELAEQLSKDGFSAMPISGELQQGQRTRTLAAFRNGSVEILVATDVAARGLDIPDVGMVVHGSPPMDSESYTHRSGRTGRAGNKGRCVLLAPYHQRGLVSRLLNQARIEASWEEVPNAKRVQKALVKKVRRQIYSALEDSETPPADLLDYSQRLLSNRDPALVVATLLQQFQPKPATEPREIGKAPQGRFDDRPPRGRYDDRRPGPRRDRGAPPRHGGPDRRGSGPPARHSGPPSAGFTRFGINWGERQGANPKRLLAVICRRGDVSGRKVGSIRIDSYNSTFEVSTEVASHFASNAQRPDSRDPKIKITKL